VFANHSSRDLPHAFEDLEQATVVAARITTYLFDSDSEKLKAA
jgi:hypothetical protein